MIFMGSACIPLALAQVLITEFASQDSRPVDVFNPLASALFWMAHLLYTLLLAASSDAVWQHVCRKDSVSGPNLQLRGHVLRRHQLAAVSAYKLLADRHTGAPVAQWKALGDPTSTISHRVH